MSKNQLQSAYQNTIQNCKTAPEQLCQVSLRVLVLYLSTVDIFLVYINSNFREQLYLNFNVSILPSGQYCSSKRLKKKSSSLKKNTHIPALTHCLVLQVHIGFICQKSTSDSVKGHRLLESTTICQSTAVDLFSQTLQLVYLAQYCCWFLYPNTAAGSIIQTLQLVYLAQYCCWFLQPNTAVRLFSSILLLVSLAKHCSWFIQLNTAVGFFIQTLLLVYLHQHYYWFIYPNTGHSSFIQIVLLVFIKQSLFKPGL